MMIIDDYFPEKGKLVLSANGKEFIERLGVEATRKVIFGVLQGENIRTQTEPLTRRRIAIATGAMVHLFAKGWSEMDNFSENISNLAIEQLNNTASTHKDIYWPAQWLIGLTGKSYQNVLRGNPELRQEYIDNFENAIQEASEVCLSDFGPITMSLGYVVDKDTKENIHQLDWKDIIRLTTAIGATTLTIRGSEKSTYGKIFEHLVMGSVLSILGFQHVENAQSVNLEKVFWLSDSTDDRECDATIRLRPGRIARFDIGFIGKGNPEIMKDKLTRYSREVEQNGLTNYSQTFIIVDRMPDTTKTTIAAARTGAEIVQMSMQYWPIELAVKLKSRLGYDSEILNVKEEDYSDYLESKLKDVSILDFVSKKWEEGERGVRETTQPYLLNRDDDEESDDELSDNDFENLL